MTDIIDKANEAAEIQLAHAIETAKARPHPHLIKGRCNYCGESVVDYFCDADCRDDYEREQKIKQLNGRG
ncbi:hypothetical protein [Ostreibacterium oceani]|uniref:DUF2116 family Zn-ribbon domain-containing protein n=1 Tax=Ostreibacterium oceani TaxID=2654998 RepID=A0A6N7EZD2_9GAMM|nr:hypothetical protein [Ostreibacterium oceani]MPV86885.1 hypothetical protein [Ostreibacterium oceani]